MKAIIVVIVALIATASSSEDGSCFAAPKGN
jgi:hypothetical protein